LKLRLTDGVDVDEVLLNRAKDIPGKYININNGMIRLTKEGFLIANKIIGELL